MILVTGASGLNGSAVIREFARQGAPVRALVRSRDKAAALLDLPTVEVVEGDMAKPDALGAAFDGVDRALLISSSDPHMLETQCTFIDAAKRAGVAHVVKFSGAESGCDPLRFRFTRIHEEIERHLEQSGLAWTHLRPCGFMQVYLREAATIFHQGALFLPMGEVTSAPVDIEDIAKVAVALLRSGGHEGKNHEGKSYPMTGPEALHMADIAAHISRASGKPVRYVAISPDERRAALLAAGIPRYFADALFEQATERLRHPDARIHLETHEAFGVRPTTFGEFAIRNAAAFRARPAAA
jgi:uncharacterized protein YbjT (DUF2867 family)